MVIHIPRPPMQTIRYKLGPCQPGLHNTSDITTVTVTVVAQCSVNIVPTAVMFNFHSYVSIE